MFASKIKKHVLFFLGILFSMTSWGSGISISMPNGSLVEHTVGSTTTTTIVVENTTQITLRNISLCISVNGDYISFAPIANIASLSPGQAQTLIITSTAGSRVTRGNVTNNLIKATTSTSSAARGSRPFRYNVSAVSVGYKAVVIGNFYPDYGQTSSYGCGQPNATADATGAFTCTASPQVNNPQVDGFNSQVKITTIDNINYGVFLSQLELYGQLTTCRLTEQGVCVAGTYSTLISAQDFIQLETLDVVGNMLYSYTGVLSQYHKCNISDGQCTTAEIQLQAGDFPQILSITTSSDDSNTLYVLDRINGDSIYAIEKCNATSGVCSTYLAPVDFPTEGSPAPSPIGLTIKNTTPKRIATVIAPVGHYQSDGILECGLGASSASNCTVIDLSQSSSRSIADIRYDEISNRLYVLYSAVTSNGRGGFAYFDLDAQGKIIKASETYINPSVTPGDLSVYDDTSFKSMGFGILRANI